jgi:alginate O-acetyltransferase complex protein AlgI
VLFNSLTFAVFLAAVLPLYYALDHKRQNAMLLAASYLFYGWWNWKFLSLLWLSTAADFFIARRLNQLPEGRRRDTLLYLSVGLNLAYLGVFKYFNFFAQTLGADFAVLNVLLPVGISFYTFQSISYIVDVYRNKREHTEDFVAYALYISYFPHLVAGPIQRSTQLLPQLLEPRTVRKEQIRSGALLMLVGYFKKVAVADAVAPIVNAVFASPGQWSRGTLLLAVYLFAIQIYGDFSGYTDIARGVSRLMGIELRVNFRQPYLAANVTEFWKRWHISLSEWLRDYLYISLGGNRLGRARTYANLMITMLLGGLWHGASWTFVIWGGLHGLYLSFHKAFPTKLPRLLATILTFHLVCLAWIFFRAPSLEAAWTYLRGLALNGGPVSQGWLVTTVFYLSLILALDLPAWSRDEEQPFSPRWPVLARGLAYGAMAAMCLWIGSPDGAPFIYFQF